MNCYRDYVNLYYKGKKIYEYSNIFLTDHKDYENDVKIELTWDNIEGFVSRYSEYFPGKIVTNTFKTDTVIVFDHSLVDINIQNIKKSKNENLNLTFEIISKIENPSLKTLLEYPNGEKVIKYIAERWKS